MRTLVRWDPLTEVRNLRRAMDRSLVDFYGPVIWHRDTTLSFPVDIFETDERVVVKAALPGIKPDDVEISVSEGVLLVKGESSSEESTDGESYHTREIRYGAFQRAIRLPAEVSDEKAEAEFKDGVLTVTLPKAEEVRPKQIKIKTAPELNGSKSG